MIILKNNMKLMLVLIMNNNILKYIYLPMRPIVSSIVSSTYNVVRFISNLIRDIKHH